MTDLPAERSAYGEDGAALTRIAAALDRMAPPPVPAPDFTQADAYVWHPDPDRLQPVAQVSRVPLSALVDPESRDWSAVVEQIRAEAASPASFHPSKATTRTR